MKRMYFRFFWLGPVGLLAGCGAPAPVPDDVFLRLSAPPVIPSTGRTWPADEVRVAPIAASGLHRERALVVTEDAGSTLTQSRYRLWIDSPERMLQAYFAACLRDAGVAPRVVDEPGARTGFAVVGRLLRFEQEIGPGTSRVIASIEFAVRDVRREESVFTRDFSAEEVLTDASPTAVAQGMSRATARICADFVGTAGPALNAITSREPGR